jgi:hypothetical protein
MSVGHMLFDQMTQNSPLGVDLFRKTFEVNLLSLASKLYHFRTIAKLFTEVEHYSLQNYTFQLLHSRVGSWPHPQKFDWAGKA